MSAETLPPLKTSFISQLEELTDRLKPSNEPEEVITRTMKILEKVLINAGPGLRLTQELRVADDIEFLSRVLADSLALSPTASKRDRLRLKGKIAFQRQIQAAGGTYSTRDVASLLGVGTDAIRKRRTRGHLIAIPQGEHYGYPTFQFDNNGVIEHIPEVLDALQAESPVDSVQFFLTLNADLGSTPLEGLKQGADLDYILRLAGQFGRQLAQ